MMNNRRKKSVRRRIMVIGAVGIVCLLLFSVFVVMFNGGVRAASVVKPPYRSGETEDFDNDTIGMDPASLFYTYIGDWLVENETIPVSGYEFYTYEGNNSLNMSGTDGESCEFVFNETNYFSMDFKLMLRSPQSTDTQRYTFSLRNSTDDVIVFTIDWRYNFSNYNNALDFNDDFHNNEDDFYEFYTVYGWSGTPGSIKEDLNADGHVNAGDVSLLVSHYISTDWWDFGFIMSIPDFYAPGYDLYQEENMFSYTNLAPDGGNGTDCWLHFYLQCGYSGVNFSGFEAAYRTEDEGFLPGKQWVNALPEYYIGGLGIWDRMNISLGTTGQSHCWLDNLTMSYTPPELIMQAYTPAMNATVTPTMTEGNWTLAPRVNNDFSVTILNTTTPLFATVRTNIYSEAGGTAYNVWNTTPVKWREYSSLGDYDDATNTSYSSLLLEVDGESTVRIGQNYTDPVHDHWTIYRTGVSFDTDLPAGAVVDVAWLAFEGDMLTGNIGDIMGLYCLMDTGGTYPIMGSPYPPGGGILDDWDASNYAENEWTYAQNPWNAGTIQVYPFWTPDQNHFTIPASFIDTDGDTRFLFREEYEVLNDDTRTEEIFTMNMTSHTPYLYIGYHIPSYDYVPTISQHDYMIQNNRTIVFEQDLHVAFSTTYQYIYTIFPITGEDSSWGHWEFPASGYEKAGKFCYQFMTSDYPEPRITSFTPHNTTAPRVYEYLEPPGANLTVTFDSQTGDYGDVKFFVLVGTTWVDLGTGHGINWHVADGGNTTYIQAADFGDTIYWRVEAKDAGTGRDYSTWQEYPNATQSGSYRYGHRCWNFTIDANDPPWVHSYSPANNSHFNPFLDTFYLNVSDNNTGETVDYNVFIMQEIMWGNGTIHDSPIWVSESAHWEGGTSFTAGTDFNFTFTPADAQALYFIQPENGTNYSFAFQFNDEDNTVEYPTGWGKYHAMPQPEIGDRWINYIADYMQGNDFPTLNVTYPVCGATYTKTQWRTNHIMHVVTADAEGDDITLFLTIQAGNTTIAHGMQLSQTKTYFDTDTVVSDYILHNGSYDFDLSYYVPFDNYNYTFTVTARDDFHPSYMGGTSRIIPFTIGTPPGATYHLAVMDFFPGHEELNGFSAISDGITGYVALNTDNPTSDPAYDGKVQMTFALDDGETTSGVWLSTPTLLSPMTYNKLLWAGGYYIGFPYMGDYPWSPITIHVGMQSRHNYKLYFGLYLQETTWFSLYNYNAQPFGSATIELDQLYDDSATPATWKLEYGNNLNGYKYAFESMTGSGTTNPLFYPFLGDYLFEGGRIDFSTYPPGEGPSSSGSMWGRTYINFASSVGIGGAGVIFALLIIGICLILPYILVKRRSKNVPMPLLALTGCFGFILSFGMGFIEMWVVIIPFFIGIIVIVYKAWGWIQSAAAKEE